MRSPRTAPRLVPRPGRGGLCRRSLPAARRRHWQTRPVDFYSAYAQGFARVAACTLPHRHRRPARQRGGGARAGPRPATSEGVAVAIFPELCLTGYSIDDLLLQETAARRGGGRDRRDRRGVGGPRPVLVVGAPLRSLHRIYNCAVVIHRGRVLGVAPKVHLPNYREFYEHRHFASGGDQAGGRVITVAGEAGAVRPRPAVPGTRRPGLVLHVEICEDMWVPVPPSANAALAGATVLSNLSGSPDHRGPRRGPQAAARSGSARCLAAYLFAAAGLGESSTDLSWDGQTMVYEVGELLGETRALPRRSAAYDGRRRPHPDPPGAAAPGHLRRQPAQRAGRSVDVDHGRVHSRPAGR